MESIKDILDTIEKLNFTDAEKIRFLKLKRCKLLNDIHKKQQLLDQIDYYIHKICK